MTNEILVVKKLNTFYPLELKKGQKKLLDNINLLVQQNDVLGLVGETGAGKSILIDSIGRNLEPPLWSDAETLSIHLDSKSENLLEKGADELRNIWGNGIAFIPPNARERLNPIMNVGQQVSNVIQSNSNLSRKESDKKVVEIFEMVKMPDPENNFFSFPHELSGGMAQRVIISVALSMSPKLLLADEPTMGLDVTIQAQVLDLMAELLKEKFEAAAILATRDLGIVANFCNKIAVMCNGQLVEFSGVREFFEKPVHPYSEYLLNAAFATHRKEGRIQLGTAKTKVEIESSGEAGCRFAPRCPLVEENCWSIDPPEKLIGTDHYVRCHVLG